MVAEKVKTVSDELNIIRKSNGGFLDPVKVVEFARNPDTLLHSKFTWDDGKAAEQYRLWQARQVIRVSVTYEDLPGRREAIQVRTYFSLPSDRKLNGYRATDDILKNVQLSAELLSMAKLELRTFRQKYKDLKELSEVICAIDNIL